MIYILLLLSIGATYGVRNTNVYLEYYDNNKDMSFYDSRTFGIDLDIDPCTKIDNNAKFRDIINSKFTCLGAHCRDGTFSCPVRGGKHCYHVEHIIDENGPEMMCPGSKNIVANMVMIWGKWNSALGGLSRLHYDDSMAEKELVMGKSKIAAVRAAVEKCMNAADMGNNTYDPRCDTDENCNCDSDSSCGCDCDYEYVNIVTVVNTQTAVLVIAIIILIFGIALAVYGMYYKVKLRKYGEAKQLIEQKTEVTVEDDQSSSTPQL